jgi:NTE family protein
MSGKRVVFGQTSAPEADLAEAVAASCAIPGFFEPVLIHGRRYVDGGLHSLCNLDLLEDSNVDVVICISAMTSGARIAGSTPLRRAIYSLLSQGREQLRQQAEVLINRGVDVVVIEPTAKDHAAMGVNLMDARRWESVLEVAQTSVAAQLRRRNVKARLEAMRSAA